VKPRTASTWEEFGTPFSVRRVRRLNSISLRLNAGGTLPLAVKVIEEPARTRWPIRLLLTMSSSTEA
jgi:hypothetical protein